jgi:demethylmenaquinone methyltransferase/2-methoxy-6-polyprenyl-1,4-benzoquinol methylase
MIPFNRLGFLFKVFSSLVYPLAFRAALASSLREVPGGGAVLDVGSGTGILSRFGRKARGDLVFITLDPAAGMLRFSPSFARGVLGRAEHLPFRERSLEAVLAGDCMHHFNDPGGAVMEFRRVLRPGGLLVVFEIDPGKGMGAAIGRAERMFREPAHFYRPGELAGRLEASGFECGITRYGWRYAITAHAVQGDGHELSGE